MEGSPGAAGSCGDSATKESFFSSARMETIFHGLIPAIRRQAELAVFDYIESFYDAVRRHGACG